VPAACRLCDKFCTVFVSVTKTTPQLQRLRTVNACFVFYVSLAQTREISGTARASLAVHEFRDREHSEMTVNTACGVFEIFPLGRMAYKVNVRGAKDFAGTARVMHKVAPMLYVITYNSLTILNLIDLI